MSLLRKAEPIISEWLAETRRGPGALLVLAVEHLCEGPGPEGIWTLAPEKIASLLSGNPEDPSSAWRAAKDELWEGLSRLWAALESLADAYSDEGLREFAETAGDAARAFARLEAVSLYTSEPIFSAVAALEQLSLYPCRALDEVVHDQLRRWMLAHEPDKVKELEASGIVMDRYDKYRGLHRVAEFFDALRESVYGNISQRHEELKGGEEPVSLPHTREYFRARVRELYDIFIQTLQTWQARFRTLDEAAVRKRIDKELPKREARIARAVLFGEGAGLFYDDGKFVPDIETLCRIKREDGLLAFLAPRLPFAYARKVRMNAARFSGEPPVVYVESMEDAETIPRSGRQSDRGWRDQTCTLSRAAELLGVSRFKLTRDLPKMGFARKGRTDVYSFTDVDLAKMRKFYNRSARLSREKKVALITLVAEKRGCTRDAARVWIDRRLKKGLSLEEIVREAWRPEG
ncbi:MAG: hypothetical protein ACUVT4_12170 [Actinomycetota bacterium]